MRKGPALGIKRNNQGSLNMVRPVGCLDSVGGEHLDAAAPEVFHGIRSVRRPVARVHHRRDPDAGIEQLIGKRPARVIHDRPPPLVYRAARHTGAAVAAHRCRA